MRNDDFEILGLEPGASPEQIKQAYRDLVAVWHPDRHAANRRLQEKAEAKLKEINAAYERLQARPGTRSDGAPFGNRPGPHKRATSPPPPRPPEPGRAPSPPPPEPEPVAPPPDRSLLKLAGVIVVGVSMLLLLSQLKPVVDRSEVAPTPPTPESGVLIVTSEAAGAEVWLDDRFLGATKSGVRIMQHLPSGSHVISARLAGLSRKQPVDIVAGWYNYVIFRKNPERAGADDGAPMIKIPAGEFWMGSDTGPKDEVPRHLVHLDSYYLDKFEVTNRRYERFRLATGRSKNFLEYYHHEKKLDEPDKPVVAVTWSDADDYCRWVGKRLPTEAEWERAARDTDERIFPWGNEFDGSFMKWLNGSSTAAVGSRPRDVTREKVFDLAGNVSEWVADGYFLYEKERQRNPQVPQEADKPRVIRGGSYDHWDSINYRSARRDAESPKRFDHKTGFRCAKSVEVEQPAE